MDIHVFAPGELGTVFRVLRTALSPTGALSARERRFLETYARITGYVVPGGAEPAPIAAGDARVDGAHRRKRLVQLAAIATLFDNPVKKTSVRFVKDLAKALGVSDPVLPVLQAVAEGKTMKARLLTARRGMRALAKEAYVAEGVRGVIRFFAALFLRTRVNRDKMWSYKRLGLLPEGTLGREYWKHLTELGFGFPGEPNGIPQSVAYHDIAHVLAGNDTTPLGEIQQGSFQGGNRREDGFFFIQFVLLHFHHGIRITPVAPAEVGNFDPVKVLWAIHRGATCNVDVTHQWDFWPLMPLPLEKAREKCGLVPKIE